MQVLLIDNMVYMVLIQNIVVILTMYLMFCELDILYNNVLTRQLCLKYLDNK